jgi:hypothetical protein
LSRIKKKCFKCVFIAFKERLFGRTLEDPLFYDELEFSVISTGMWTQQIALTVKQQTLKNYLFL